MTIGVIILAAGESTRMGQPKQLLTFRGTTLLQHTLDHALSLPGAPVALVLGANASQIRPVAPDSRVLIVENQHWREGLGTSVRLGLQTILEAHPGLSAAIFLVCDQPLLSPAILGDLVATHTRTAAPIVAAEYAGTFGVPALFARPLFPELLALSGEKGARAVIRAHQHEAIGIPFEAGAIDIDTPADYEGLQEIPGAASPALSPP